METSKQIILKARAGSVLSFSWNVLWEKFITLFLINLVVWVVVIPMSAAQSHDSHSFLATVMGTFSFLYLIFIVSPFKISAAFLYLKAIRGADFEVKELFDVFKNYLNVVLASLLSIAIIGIGLFFVVIPGVIFACRLAFVPFLVMDKKLDAVKAVEESWRLTRGYGWRIFWLYIVSFFLIIAGFIVLVFGAVIAFMWIKAAFATFYQAVLEERGEYTLPVENKIVEVVVDEVTEIAKPVSEEKDNKEEKE